VGGFSLDPDDLARAEAALAGLAADYIQWAEADMARLKDALGCALAEGEREAAVAELFAIAHDVKGQAGTFGYGLLSTLGGRLCKLIQATPDDTAAMAALVNAMAEVVAARLSGDGGERGQALLAALD
jgi:hypothetical protein